MFCYTISNVSKSFCENFKNIRCEIPEIFDNLEDFDLLPEFSVQISENPNCFHQHLGKFGPELTNIKQHVESKTANMRKYLTKFSRCLNAERCKGV